MKGFASASTRLSSSSLSIICHALAEPFSVQLSSILWLVIVPVVSSVGDGQDSRVVKRTVSLHSLSDPPSHIPCTLTSYSVSASRPVRVVEFVVASSVSHSPAGALLPMVISSMYRYQVNVEVYWMDTYLVPAGIASWNNCHSIVATWSSPKVKLAGSLSVFE